MKLYPLTVFIFVKRMNGSDHESGAHRNGKKKPEIQKIRNLSKTLGLYAIKGV